jgi:thymidylate kinase
MSRRPHLIAVDGANGRAVVAAAQRLAHEDQLSRWDASGLFEQLVMNGDDISMTSPRLLLLLYAADLAFRLRWEIEPALAEGRSVVAAPYIDTAMAFGRACGCQVKWLNNLFSFGRRPTERHVVSTPPARAKAKAGFVEFALGHLESLDGAAVARRTGTYLRTRRGSRVRDLHSR